MAKSELLIVMGVKSIRKKCLFRAMVYFMYMSLVPSVLLSLLLLRIFVPLVLFYSDDGAIYDFVFS